MFKKHELYMLYELYINSKKISNGAKKLLKISEFSFEDFRFSYMNNLNFKMVIDKIILSEIRDKKIDSLIGENIRKRYY